MEKEYRFFEASKARQELIVSCGRIADYLHDNTIKNFILIDRSARPAHIGVRKMWKRKYPDEPMPDIYFLNPKGWIGKAGLFNRTKVMFDGLRSGGMVEIRQDFKKAYKHLLLHKDQPTLIFDTCIHWGDTVRPVLTNLKNIGFSDLRFGIVNNSYNCSKIEPDFVAFKGVPDRACRPFGYDEITEKRRDTVTSSPNMCRIEREISVRLRQEISRIFSEDPQGASTATFTPVAHK